jgi:site-specific DNA-methyltransferase (adenine-specific)
MINLYQGDCLEELKKLPDNSVDSLVTDPPAGISFMGKEWDSDKGGRDGWIKWMSEVMTECKRVMKPGAHGLVWAIPRTSHWTATALEDAGFEVRDVITHLFGSGFPKSLDISKAIDKAAGVERTEFTPYVYPDGNTRINHAQTDGSSFKSGGKAGTPNSKPSTDDAKQWQGWGTALKPASEHWILIRKPLEEKTVAANVIKHGCGGINIDASRIGTDIIKHNRDNKSLQKFKEQDGRAPKEIVNPDPTYHQGRFPANLVLSHSPYCQDDQCDIECAIVKLDEQSGTLKSGVPGIKRAGNNGPALGKESRLSGTQMGGYADSGGASRFFYCAKISSSERNAGAVNSHPTVKPKKLMSYFIKMITPPNGTVLDPFMGSGSTGIAAIETGFKFIGIEKEPEYFEIAKGRIQL